MVWETQSWQTQLPAPTLAQLGPSAAEDVHTKRIKKSRYLFRDKWISLPSVKYLKDMLMIGPAHPELHFRSRRSWRKLSVHPADKQINTERPHHLLYGSCSKNKSLPLRLMFFYQQHNKSVPSSGVQNVNLDHSSQILPVLNLQPLQEPSLQCRQLIHHTDSTALQLPSSSTHLQDQHLEPKTHPQHLQELTFRAPGCAANSSAVTQNMGQKSPEMFSARGKMTALIYRDFPVV